jgi:putative colanic acid biosynthesis acetyltransferase WcaF
MATPIGNNDPMFVESATAFAQPSRAEMLAVRVGPKECPSPHSGRNKLGRVLWGMVWFLLFRPSPRVLHGWRRCLLRLFGATIALGAKISPSARIWAPWNLTLGEYCSVAHGVDCYCVAPIAIGAHATVSQYTILCTATHDIHDPHMRLLTAPIVIRDQAWACAAAFICPGVTIGEGGVAGARSVITKDIAPWTVVCGNPGRPIKARILRTGPIAPSLPPRGS